jgi:hypothetical protein
LFRLPVSGAEFTLREPAGFEDVLILEEREPDLRLALRLLKKLARPLDGRDFDPRALTIADFEALLLRVHQMVFGDRISSVLKCGAEGCGAPVDVSFAVESYLAHHRPRRPKGIVDSEKPGWFRTPGGEVSYRLPLVGDLLACADPGGLAGLCLDPQQIPASLLRRVEKAMEQQAPSLSSDMEGRCPECGKALHFFFDVAGFVLGELRGQAGFIYQDTHLLAFHYHWSESRILAMPRNRRLQYVEMIRGEAP